MNQNPTEPFSTAVAYVTGFSTRKAPLGSLIIQSGQVTFQSYKQPDAPSPFVLPIESIKKMRHNDYSLTIYDQSWKKYRFIRARGKDSIIGGGAGNEVFVIFWAIFGLYFAFQHKAPAIEWKGFIDIIRSVKPDVSVRYFDGRFLAFGIPGAIFILIFIAALFK